jgi:hypothetical protein
MARGVGNGIDIFTSMLLSVRPLCISLAANTSYLQYNLRSHYGRTSNEPVLAPAPSRKRTLAAENALASPLGTRVPLETLAELIGEPMDTPLRMLVMLAYDEAHQDRPRGQLHGHQHNCMPRNFLLELTYPQLCGSAPPTSPLAAALCCVTGALDIGISAAYASCFGEIRCWRTILTAYSS